MEASERVSAPAAMASRVRYDFGTAEVTATEFAGRAARQRPGRRRAERSDNNSGQTESNRGTT
jgi:hypothetical protein